MISRRRLLKSSLLASLGSVVPALARATPMSTPWRNWSGHLVANPRDRLAPTSEDDLVSIIKKTQGALRPVGAGHSFMPLVPTDGYLLALDNLNGLISHDPEGLTAELGAGTRLSDAGVLLDGIGQAMFNLPDIDRQTLAGAISTSTHGTGPGFKSLSGYVNKLRVVTMQGEVLDIDSASDRDLFDAARVSLGSLGIITRIDFQNREPFRLRSKTWLARTEEVLEGFDSFSKEYQHFECMPLLHSDYSFVIAHQETDAPLAPLEEEDDGGELFALLDATPVALRGSLINSLAGETAPTEGVDKSFNALTNLRFDRFNEMEYSVPADAGPSCLREILKAVKESGADVVIPLEYRTIAGDDTWLSMFSGGPRVSISTHRMARHDYRPLFDLVEPIFWRYGGRPHWGKVHTLGFEQLSALYPRLRDFVALRQSLDPEGRLLNDHLRRVFKA